MIFSPDLYRLCKILRWAKLRSCVSSLLPLWLGLHLCTNGMGLWIFPLIIVWYDLVLIKTCSLCAVFCSLSAFLLFVILLRFHFQTVNEKERGRLVVRESVHSFLLDLCCSHKYGIGFHDPSLGTAERYVGPSIILKCALKPFYTMN